MWIKFVNRFGQTIVTPPHVRIKTRTFITIRKLHKVQQQVFSNAPYTVNRDSWKGAIKWYDEQRKLLSKDEEEVEALKEASHNGTNFNNDVEFDDNPFLDDDDE